jgi:hypothetical protein
MWKLHLRARLVPPVFDLVLAVGGLRWQGAQFSLQMQVGQLFEPAGRARIGQRPQCTRFLRVGSGFSVISRMPIGSGCSLVDYVTLGSTGSFRAYARLGSSISVFSNQLREAL